MVVVKNGSGLLGLEMIWFCACRYKFRKAKSYFDSYWVDIVKNGRDLIDHWTFKARKWCHKWFLINWADWLNDFCMLGEQSTLFLWHLNAEGLLQLYLTTTKKCQITKYGQKRLINRSFCLFWKNLSLVFAGNVPK